MNSKSIGFVSAAVIAAFMFIASVPAPWFLVAVIGCYLFFRKVIPFVISMFTSKEAFSASMVFIFAIGAGVLFVLRDFDIDFINSTTAGVVLAAGIALYVFKGFDVVYGKIRNLSI